jgi:hypothetical protein
MDWSKDKDMITKAYFVAMDANNMRLFELIKDHHATIKEAYPLIEYVSERLAAVVTLTMEGQLWDADIIVRSALETLVKYALIADAEENERPALLHEFWYDLSEIYTVKLSEQAKKNLNRQAQNETHRLAYTPLIISPEEEERLRSKWTKAARTQMEQKWSFTGIVNYLSKKHQGQPLENIDFVTHTYRMASHIAHGDEMGINLIRERNSRSEEERNAVHIAHYLRLLNDCFHYSLLTSLYTTKYLKVQATYFTELGKSLKEIHDLTDQYHKVPFEDKIYDRFR